MAKYNDDDIIWRTIGGRRIPIRTGQSLSEAMKESGKFNTKSKKTEEEKQKMFNDTMDKRESIIKKLDEETKDLSEYDKYNLAVSKLENTEGMSATERQYWAGTRDRYEDSMSYDAYDKGVRESEKFMKEVLSRNNKKEMTSKEASENQLKRLNEYEDAYDAYDKAMTRANEKKSNKDSDYELYKRAKENPESIDPMTENSTDWEALDKKYSKKYNDETNKNFHFAGEELYSDDPNRFGDKLRKYNEKMNPSKDSDYEFYKKIEETNAKNKGYEIPRDENGESKFVKEMTKSKNRDDIVKQLNEEAKNVVSPSELNTRTRNNADLAEKIINDDEWNDVRVSYQGSNEARIINERTGKSEKITPSDTKESLSQKIEKTYASETKSKSEAQKYYEKLSEKDIADDLKERKRRLENNFYDKKDKEKYEKFYNDGKKYYDEKINSSKSRDDVVKRLYDDYDDIDKNFPELSKRVTEDYNKSIEQASKELGYNKNTSDGKEFMEIQNRAREIYEKQNNTSNPANMSDEDYNKFKESMKKSLSNIGAKDIKFSDENNDWRSSKNNESIEESMKRVANQYEKDKAEGKIGQRLVENKLNETRIRNEAKDKKTTNEIMNDAIRNKVARKRNKNVDDLPQRSKIKTQGTSNRKEVSENIQAHILDYYDSPDDFIEQMDAMSHLPNNWKRGEEIAKGGSYLIYNGDMADFLNELKINPKGKTFSEDKAFDMYTSLVGRESAKLYDRLKKNSYKKYLQEHPNSDMSFAEFKDMRKQ